jgi:hypothetical protein
VIFLCGMVVLERVGDMRVDKWLVWQRYEPRTQIMGQQRQSRRTRQARRTRRVWQSGGQNLWLSKLVSAMEKFSRPELRAVPCDRMTLAAVRTHLARPASAYLTHSNFSLRN